MAVKKKSIILITVTASLAVIISVLLGLWFGTFTLQKTALRIACKDEPSSIPYNYDDILSRTNLTTESYGDGLFLDRIETANLKEDALCVVNFHGGYYVGGGRHNQEPFARLIASYGFRVFNVDYSLAPENTYPTQLTEANAALKYVAEAYPDAKGYVVSGDSAGAHLAAQLAAFIGSDEYRKRLNLEGAIPADRLLGVIGNCGFYNAATAAESGFFFVKNALSMFVGTRKYWEYEYFDELNLHNYADAYPDVMLICGDKDKFITENTAFRDVLTEKKVRVETYFPESEKNSLGHEFQCNYEIEESYIATEKIIEFLNTLTTR